MSVVFCFITRKDADLPYPLIGRISGPDKMTKAMIEDYLLYLKKEKGNALTTVGSVITGLRFFYNHVVGDEQLSPCCTFAKTPSKLPTVLSQQEIWSIITATNNLKGLIRISQSGNWMFSL